MVYVYTQPYYASKIAVLFFVFFLKSFQCTSQEVIANAKTVLRLYEQNQIAASYALLDSLRFATQDSCNKLEYVLLKSDRYRIKNNVRKAYKYLKFKEPDIVFCASNDLYKFKLQKAYLASEADHINIAADLLEALDSIPHTISDTSSFGIKKLHLKSKIAKHFGRLDECRTLIAQAIRIQEYRDKLTHPESSGFFRTLAYSYLEEGQFEKAREFFRMERQIYARHEETFPRLLGVMFYNEANTHYEQLDIQDAISDYDSTLFYWAIDPPSKVYMRYAHEALGDLHYEIGNIELASKYWTRASEIKPPKNNDKTDQLPRIETLTTTSDFDKLSFAYNEALEFRKSIYGENHALTGECLTFVGRLSELQNDPQKAMQTYNEALGILIDSFDFRRDHIPLETLDKVDRYGFDALLGMTRIYMELYTDNGNELFLDSAYRISEYAFSALDKVKVSYEDSHTALFWSGFTYPLTELSLQIHHRLNELSNSNKFTAKAFQNSEASRSYLLRSILHKDKILRKGKLPEEVKNKEQSLTGALHRLKGSIRMEEKRCGDAQQAKIKVWQSELVKIQQEYASFLAEMSIDYPKHFKQLYEIPSIETSELMESLDEKKMTFISYFYGDKNIYRFHSENSEIRIKKIPITLDFKHTFDLCISQISNYQYSPELRTCASKLYQWLLSDLMIPDETSLIIIPDGPLYYLPWETLVVTQGSNNTPTYLIEKYPISYVQSASLLADYIHSPPKSGNYFLSIIPDYRTSLAYGSKDIFHNIESFEIHELTGENVTKPKLINQITKADIVHFAGHSTTNDDNDMLSELDLGKYETEPLHNHEIFDMNLDAALVVLSSCHSGSGQYARGEGIINFAQAFQKAGSESVVLSHWNVDDKSTSELFSIFYNALVTGKSKGAALREAKLSFIENDDPLISHPYFWASFTLYGDDDPIKLGTDNWNFLFYFLIGCLILGLGYKFFNHSKINA